MSIAVSPWAGGAFGGRGACVLAPNPGPMTLDGTNTWVLREPGAALSVVVDPGPLIDSHLDAVVAAAQAGPDGAGDGGVGLILVTHHHHDHTEAVRELAARVGAPVRATSSAWCVDAPPLQDGELIDIDGLELRVVATPGHTADSTSFVLPAERVLLTGDMVLGRGTTIVAHPDGQLGPYFGSLDRMRSLVSAGEVATLWPAHGPVLSEALEVLDFYIAHRRERLEQVQAALVRLGAEARVVDADAGLAAGSGDSAGAGAGGGGGVEGGALGDDGLARRIVEIVYADVDESLWDAAELSVRAQLVHIAAG